MTIATTLSRTLATTLALALATLASAGQLTLKRAVTLDPAAPIRIADVAHLRGDDAIALADIVITPDASAWAAGRPWRELTLAEVNEALSSANTNTGRIALSGAACTVRLAGVTPAQRDARPDTPAEPPPTIGITDPKTVRAALMRELAARYAVTPDHLRVRFSSRDQEFLNQTTHGRTVVVTPGTGDQSARAALNVRILAGNRITDHHQVRADVEVWMRAVTLTAAIARGDKITPGHITENHMWVAPTARLPIASSAEAIGQTAQTRLDAGQVLRAGHVEPPIVIRRNDLVDVIVIHGTCRVATKARAQHDARRGERIELRIERTRKAFVGTVDGPGSAIVND